MKPHRITAVLMFSTMLLSSLCYAQDASSGFQEETSLTLESAIQMALDYNQQLKAAEQNIEVAQAERITAGLRPNPVLSVEGLTGSVRSHDEPSKDIVANSVTQSVSGGAVNDLLTGVSPVLGNSAEGVLSGNLSRQAIKAVKHEAHTVNLSLSQEIEVAGKRTFRVKAADAGLQKSKWETADTRRLLEADVKQAFFNLLLAQERSKLATEVYGINQSLLDIAQERLAVGDIAETEVNLVRAEVARAEREEAKSQGEIETAQAELKKLMGVYGPARLRADGDTAWRAKELELEHLLELAGESRPDLKALQSELDVSGHEVSLARAKRIPNPEVSLLVQKEIEGEEFGKSHKDMYGLGVSVPLPVFDRNQGQVRETAARHMAAEYQLAYLKESVKSETLGAIRKYHAAVAQLDIMESKVLPAVTRNLEAAKEAYRLGEIDVAETLLAQNALAESRKEYLDTLLDFHTTVVELERAVGLRYEEL